MLHCLALHGPFTSYVEVLKLLDKAEAEDAAAIMKIAEQQGRPFVLGERDQTNGQACIYCVWRQ
jgi:hypothetical protein